MLPPPSGPKIPYFSLLISVHERNTQMFLVYHVEIYEPLIFSKRRSNTSTLKPSHRFSLVDPDDLNHLFLFGAADSNLTMHRARSFPRPFCSFCPVPLETSVFLTSLPFSRAKYQFPLFFGLSLFSTHIDRPFSLNSRSPSLLPVSLAFSFTTAL